MGVEKMTDKLTKKMLKIGILSEKEREYSNYFIQIRLEQFITVTVIFLLAFIVNRFFQTLMFWAFFRALRRHCGGYHASTYVRCFISSVGIYALFALFGCDLMLSNIIASQVIFMIMALIVFILGAVNNEYIDWDKAELKASKKRVRITAAIELTAVIITYIRIGANDFVAYMAFAVMLCGLSLLMGQVTQKERSNK